MLRRDVLFSTSLDRGAAQLLATLADKETEGNRSQFLRRAIREAAERRGVAIDGPAAKSSGGHHASTSGA